MSAKAIGYWATTIFVAARAVGRRPDGSRAWARSPGSRPARRRVRHASWLSSVRAHDPGRVEAARRSGSARAAFSAAQGMGICGHVLRNDGRGFLAVGERCRCRYHQLSPVRRCSCARFVGVAAVGSDAWHPLSRRSPGQAHRSILLLRTRTRGGRQMSASDQRHSGRSEKTRQCILAAAQRLFLERGFQATSTDAILADAGSPPRRRCTGICEQRGALRCGPREPDHGATGLLGATSRRYRRRVTLYASRVPDDSRS